MSKWELFEREAAEDVRLAYLNGQDSIPKFIPERIRILGGSLFDQKDDSVPRRIFDSENNEDLHKIMRILKSRRQKCDEY